MAAQCVLELPAPMRLAHLLSPALLALAISACGGAGGDAAGQSDEAIVAPPWDTEAEVADPSAYARDVLGFFDKRAVRGTFVSDHPKQHGAHAGESVSIAYAIVRAPEGQEKGAVVVATGRTESFSHYAELSYDLVRRGYTLYLIDHRGQGHSSRLVDYAAVGDRDYQKGHVDDFQHYVDDFAKFIDVVVRPDRVGKSGKLFGLAHSMGGAIATLYAEQHPDTFAAIAMSSPMHQIKSSKVLLDVGQMVSWIFPTVYAAGKGPRDDQEPFEANELTGSRARFEAKLAVWNGDPSTKIGGPTYGWVNQAVEATERLQRDAGNVRVPVLLLEAGADQVVAPEGQHVVCDKINAAAPRPLCTLVTLDGSQHEGLLEVDPIRHRALDLVADFFGRQD